ncbi:FHA domain-containing protein [Dysgonomonas termitidis]|uniref:FHA domain-containing protein n=1 Tax=Dysgonomonas termitidis TaxID=1516126 RepID=A0ABV9L0J2_9BACT
MFNKLINFFAPKDEEIPKETPQQEVPRAERQEKKGNNPQTATDTVTFRSNLIEAIVNKLRPQAFADKVDGYYTLYVAGTNDDLNYQAEINKADFLNDLLLALENANITAVANVPWTIKTELPPENAAGISEVMPGIRLQYVNKVAEATPAQPVHTKARVSIWHGRGSLVQNSYQLDSTKQKTYNIGRGEFNEETFHENHIVINDRESNPDKNELNTYVSRMHAKIVFVEGKGFCLQVLPGGSKLASNGRTRIIHGEDSSVEAQNLNVRYQLFNGDIIELGRKVLLKFETADDNMTENRIRPNKGFEEEDLF